MSTARLVLVLALVCGCNAAGGAEVSEAFKALDAEMTAMANAQLFAGMAYALKGGKQVIFSKSYGKMFPEWAIDLPKDPRNVHYQIGSVQRLMVATAAWQLHTKGMLNVYDTIDNYLNATDFKLTEWCPRVYNDTTKQLQGNCTYPTLVDTMAHRTGFIDTGVHCRFPPGAWQGDWCYSGPKGTDFPLSVASALAVGALSPIQTLIAVNHTAVPLQLSPNTTFQDMTIDDYYLAAVMEKVTGQSLIQIMMDNVFRPAGMVNTFYDQSSGNDGIFSSYLPLPGYNSYVSPLSQGMYAIDFPYIGNLTLKGGNVGNKSRDPEGPPYGTFVKFAKNVLGIDGAWKALAGPAGGAVVTTFTDLGRFMTVLTRQPQLLSLNITTVRTMLTTGGVNGPGLMFAQGAITYPFGNSTKLPLGTPYAYYVGNLGYSAHQYTNFADPKDPSKDITISFVMYTKPILDAFDLSLVPSNASGMPASMACPASANASDPLNPDNGNTTCLMRVKSYADNEANFQPQYGVTGGMPPKDESAYKYFLAQAQQSGAAIGSGWVCTPHIYCDAILLTKPISGLDGYFLGKLVTATLGHSMFSPPF